MRAAQAQRDLAQALEDAAAADGAQLSGKGAVGLGLVSGDRIWVTIQAYGTHAPADFVARDVVTGHATVSTVFRDNPSFGTRLAGDFVACSADATAGACSEREFKGYGLRVDAQDFAGIVALARTANPRLSPRIQDYRLDSFQFHNEAFRNARVGLELYTVSLSLTY